jgi:hypothetical protein
MPSNVRSNVMDVPYRQDTGLLAQEEHMTLIRKIPSIAALLLSAGLSNAQTVVLDSTAGWINKQAGCVSTGNCSAGFGAGPNAITTIGQTLTAPTFDMGAYTTGGLLKSFSLFLNQQSSGFKAYVYHWTMDPADPANNLQFNDGPALFTSSTVTTGSVPANGAFKQVTFNFGNGVLLSAHQNYVVMISTSQVQTARSPGSMFGTATTDTYAGGQLIYALGGLTPAQLGSSAGLDAASGTLSNWDCAVGYPCANGVDGGDLAFKATIAIPEAEVYVMMTACLCLIGFVARRRKVSSDGAVDLT